jgi:hypothetical protein
MTKPRAETSVEDEHALLQRVGKTAEFLRERSDTFQSLCRSFALILAEDVEAALTAESQGDVAKQWVEDAISALRVNVPELALELEGRSDFIAAADTVARELEKGLPSHAVKPSSNEVAEHSAEFAQAVISNWLFILRKCKREHEARPIELNSMCLPMRSAGRALTVGADAFAVPVKVAESRFKSFVDELRNGKSIVRIAPDVFLAKSHDQWYALESKNAAEQVAGVAYPEDLKVQEKEALNSSDAVPIRLRFGPRLAAKTKLLQRIKKPLIISEKVVAVLASVAADDAMASKGQVDTGPTADSSELDRVSADLARRAMADLKIAANAGFTSVTAHIKKALFIRKVDFRGVVEVHSEDDRKRIYRASTLALKEALLGSAGATEKVTAIKKMKVHRIIADNPDAKTLYQLLFETARHGLASSDAESLAALLHKLPRDFSSTKP